MPSYINNSSHDFQTSCYVCEDDMSSTIDAAFGVKPSTTLAGSSLSNKPKSNRSRLHAKSSRKKSVRFASSRQVVDLPPLPMDAMDKVWFSAEELSIILGTCLVTMKAMKSSNKRRSFDSNELSFPGQENKSNVFCARGLEAYTKKNAKRLNEKRTTLYKTVSNIQEMQKEQGFPCHDLLAEVCRDCTEPSQQEAQSRATCDALEVGTLQS